MNNLNIANIDNSIEFINNLENINKDWSFLFLNNLSKENYTKNLIKLDKTNKNDCIAFLTVIYEQKELNNLSYFLYNEDFDIYLNNINRLFKENIIYNCDLYKIILSRANNDNWDLETLKLIYYIIQLNIDNKKVIEYTDFLKKSDMFNNKLFKREDVENKANELNNKIYKE